MSPEEFNQIFRANLPEISRFLARRMDHAQVEDLASDLFELAWNKKDSIPANLELPWLYKSARYLISNQRRKEQNRSRIFSMLQAPVSSPSAEEIALADIGLGSAWAKLKPREQELLSLWALDGLSHKEIAIVLEINENTAAIRLTRAKAKLKEILTHSENKEI